MENVVLIIHLLLALALIGVVLLQRSDGGGLGAMGGGGGGAVSTRSAATGLGKLTWILAIAFICTSLTLTWQVWIQTSKAKLAHKPVFVWVTYRKSLSSIQIKTSEATSKKRLVKLKKPWMS